MTTLADVFFLISDALLWPVLIALLFGLASVFVLTGSTLRAALSRLSRRKARLNLSTALEERRFDELETLINSRQGLLFSAVDSMIQNRDDAARVEKILADARRSFQEKLAPLRLAMKFGPALGLMGTLIPLGPALVGLAAGDLETMARNLQIAFATTVVGLLVSLIAYALCAVRECWMRRDLILLTFAAERLEKKS